MISTGERVMLEKRPKDSPETPGRMTHRVGEKASYPPMYPPVLKVPKVTFVRMAAPPHCGLVPCFLFLTSPPSHSQSF